jgi:hypothetical protein
VEKCTKCGKVRSSQVIPAIKDDNGRCMYERIKQKLRAKSGQTIDTSLDYYGPEKIIQKYGAKGIQTK